METRRGLTLCYKTIWTACGCPPGNRSQVRGAVGWGQGDGARGGRQGSDSEQFWEAETAGSVNGFDWMGVGEPVSLECLL